MSHERHEALAICSPTTSEWCKDCKQRSVRFATCPFLASWIVKLLIQSVSATVVLGRTRKQSNLKEPGSIQGILANSVWCVMRSRNGATLETKSRQGTRQPKPVLGMCRCTHKLVWVTNGDDDSIDLVWVCGYWPVIVWHSWQIPGHAACCKLSMACYESRCRSIRRSKTDHRLKRQLSLCTRICPRCGISWPSAGILRLMSVAIGVREPCWLSRFLR